MRRVVAPAGDVLLYYGPLFAVTDATKLGYQMGELPEQTAILRWLRPSAGPSASLLSLSEVESDVGALLSLALHRRVRVLPELVIGQEGSDKKTFMPLGHQPDSEVFAPIAGGADQITPLLKDIVSIAADDDFAAVAQAVGLYQGAALTMGRNNSAAYLLLVSAIEALAARFEPPPPDFHGWSEAPAWNTLLNEIGLSPAQSDAIRGRLLANTHMNLSRRFRSYVLRVLPQTFWTEEWRQFVPGVNIGTGEYTDGTWHTREHDERDRNSAAALPELLRNVYLARSHYVHAGEAFPSAEVMGFRHVQLSADPDVAANTPTDIPSLEYFERLTRAVILATITEANKGQVFGKIDWPVFVDPKTAKTEAQPG